MLQNNLRDKINAAKSQKKIIGFTNGCFDLLHKGHKYFLKKCKNHCDLLLVGLNSDTSVRKLKGINRPIESEEIRKNKLLKLKEIDEVIVFSDLTPIKLIKQIYPDVIIKGADYNEKNVVGNKFIRSNGGKVILIELLKGFSTSKIIQDRIN